MPEDPIAPRLGEALDRTSREGTRDVFSADAARRRPCCSSFRVARPPAGLADLLARIAKARAPVRTLRGPSRRPAPSACSRRTCVRPARSRSCAPTACAGAWPLPTTSRSGSVPRASPTEARTATAGSRRRARGWRARCEDLHAAPGRGRRRVWASAGRSRSCATTRAAPRSRRRRCAVDARRGRRLPGEMRFALAPDLVRPTRVLLVEGEHDRTAIEFGELVGERSGRRIVDAPAGVSRTRLSSAA